MGMTNSKQV